MAEQLPTTRAEALRLGVNRYLTGKPCNRGHIAPRTCPRGGCTACDTEDAKARWVALKGDPAALEVQYQAAAKAGAQWYALNRETVADQRRGFRARNSEKVAERNSAWARANKAHLAAKRARRRAALLQATPPWSDPARVHSFYEEAQRLSATTGIPHEVDHIYPLKGKTSCGLHVPENLRVIPRKLNRSKGNQHPEDFHETSSAR